MHNSQKGFAQVLVLLLLVAAVGVGVFLVTDRTSKSTKSSAAENSNNSLTTGPILLDKQVWAVPNIYPSTGASLGRVNPLDYDQLFSDENRVKDLLSNIDVMGFFAVDESPAWLSKAVPLLNKYNVKISLEVGGLLSYTSLHGAPACDGKKSAELELTKINQIYAAGGKVDYLSLDEPLARGMHPAPNCNLSAENTFKELLIYMKAIHQVHPEIKIGLIVSPPNWMWNNELPYIAPAHPVPNLATVLSPAIDAIKAGGEDFNFIHIDNPYDYAMGIFPDTDARDNWDPKSVNWFSRILDIQKTAEKYNIRFGVISNSQTGGDTTADTGKTFYNQSLAYIDEFKKRGGKSQDYIFESWYNNPRVLLPDNDPNTFTFMDLVRDGIRRIDTPAVGFLDGVFSCNMIIGWACDNDKASQPIDVHVYADGNFLIFTKADKSGEAGVGQNCGGYNNRRFIVNLPESLKDGRSHQLTAYALNNHNYSPNSKLYNSPQNFTCSSQPSPSLTPRPTSNPSPTISSGCSSDSQCQSGQVCQQVCTLSYPATCRGVCGSRINNSPIPIGSPGGTSGGVSSGAR